MNEGLIQEPIIMKEYIKEKERNGSSISVQNCGFFVSPTHGFLGASPDGIVSEMKDSSESSGLLEMKYIQTNDSESLEGALLRKKICVQAGDVVKVNANHKYYYQMHQQMFVTGKPWTDFVVKGSLCQFIYIERVQFNSAFWKEVLPKLKLFFGNHLLPEIAYPSIKFGHQRPVLDMSTVLRNI